MINDYTDKKYIGLIRNNLEIIDIEWSVYSKRCLWKVRCCKCGNTFSINPSIFLYGSSSKYGCCTDKSDISNEYKLTSADMSRLSSLRNIILHRCYDKGHSEYEKYGGRGIIVCEEWKNSNKNFIDWAKENGYRPWLRLRRKDRNKSYNPDNCYFNKTSDNKESSVIEIDNDKLSKLKYIDNKRFMSKVSSGEFSKVKANDIIDIYSKVESKNGDKYIKLKRQLSAIINSMIKDIGTADNLVSAIEVFKDKHEDIEGIKNNLNNIRLLVEDIGVDLNG